LEIRTGHTEGEDDDKREVEDDFVCRKQALGKRMMTATKISCFLSGGSFFPDALVKQSLTIADFTGKIISDQPVSRSI
jgi:hypothetical protein